MAIEFMQKPPYFQRSSRTVREQQAWGEDMHKEEPPPVVDEVDFLGNPIKADEKEDCMGPKKLPTYHLGGVGFGGGAPKQK